MSRMHYGDFATWVDGIGKFGDYEEFALPDLKMKAESFSGGGGIGTRKFGLVLDEQKITAKANTYDRDVYRYALPAPGSTKTFKMMGSLLVPGDEEVPIKVTWQGAMLELNRDALKPGAKTLTTFTWEDIIFYEEIVDGTEMFYVDLLNQVMRVDGVDRFAQRRRNLGR